ncbi:class I SAM-dependent methyltransferase [Streptomyces boninensis]|uniref:class I SAM-dependent methyltransferase n=1 Tax=Streptomyces boninensis TaxID=2039455 RepID=UPI003B20F28B
MVDRTVAIAEARPRYQAELAGGVERFLMPRREDCPWCGATRLRVKVRTRDFVQLKPGWFTLEECRACGHVFQNPRLNEEGLDFYYRDFYDGLGEDATTDLFGGPGARKRYVASARAMAVHDRPGKWLDVGTAHGQFPQIARPELPETVFDGLDMGESVEKAAENGHIAHAYRGTLTGLAAELAGQYDALSMFHYLEHTLEQKKELAAAHTVLRPGGHMMIEVPDPQCAFGRLFGKYWLPWFQPQHLHFATLRNLCAELEATGWTVVHASRTGDQHIPLDGVSALWYFSTRFVPDDDAPWLPKRPSRAVIRARIALLISLVPALAAVHFTERALAPVVRRTPFSNAYRVIARRN